MIVTLDCIIIALAGIHQNLADSFQKTRLVLLAEI